MAKTLDRFQPTLFEFPMQTNRTGYHPVWTSTLLVAPWSFDINGRRIDGSQIDSVTFVIEKPIQVTVAGHPQNYDPLGPKPEASPNLILFEVTLTYNDLLQNIIDLQDGNFYDSDGNLTDNPSEGDTLEFTNSRGIQGRVEYLPDAEYFDLSSVEINVDNLPTGRYIASWTVRYNKRIESDGSLFCIENNEQKSKLDYPINHPGEIHEEMVNRTPGLYLEDIDKKDDFLVNLYRPFADVLQNNFDEGELFHGINWIRKIPPQLFPYLSYLIGIEMPTQSALNLDKIRRNILERGVELQKLKGSELAIKELFSILGFTVEIINLWVDSEGDRFFAPNDPDPEPRITPRDEITSTIVSQTDPMVANYTESGFGNFEVPLLYHNRDNEIVLNAYIVEAGSEADDDLKEIINNFLSDSDYLTKDTVVNGPDGYLMLPQELLAVSESGVESFSRLVVSDIEVLSQSHTGLPVIRFDGVKYDILRDRLKVNFADYKDLSGSVAYIFATYRRDKLEVPEHLKNNQTNRFDIDIVSKVGDIEPSLYDYLIDSLFKFKAFHSLLRKISYDADLRDFYNVTDFCANSYLSQQKDSDELMIPPACPTTECFVTDECNEQNARGGLRESDQEVRNIILEGLKEEYDRWHDVTKEWLGIADEQSSDIEWARSHSNINIPIPEDEGDNYGQDRVSFDFVATADDSSIGVGDIYDMVYQGTYLESIGDTGLIFNIQPTKFQILSDLIDVGVKVEVVRQIEVGVFYVSMIIDTDHQSDIRSKITELDRLNTPDYCYKGRVEDLLGLDTLISPKTIVRNRPCNLMQGLGVYYRVNYGELNNIGGWHNDQLKKSDQSLHYSDYLFFDHIYTGSHQRPSINIEKIGNNFSGHRQIKSGLLEDFTHPTHRARPWDISDECFLLINPLNARLVEVSYGEKLEFDDSDLTYEATGVKPDIPTYSGESSNEFTHSVYTTTEERAYVELDNLEYTEDTEISTDSPVFDTARQCSDTGGYLDYIDGYAASTGELSFSVDAITAERTAIGSDLDSTAEVFAAATYSSEIFVEESESEGTIQTYNEYDLWKGHRFDCECLEYPCTEDQRNCNSFFEIKSGQYDFNNDHLDIDYAASLNETIKGFCEQFNGNIEEWLNWDFDPTEPRELEFKDEYNIQYRVMFEENEDTLDIMYETFQPRVWGRESGGYVENGKVFREGILTTIRQIFILENGEWSLNAEGTEQEVTYRQTNYDCDFLSTENKFVHFHEYQVCDEVEMGVDCGPHWTDPDVVNNVFWEEFGTGAEITTGQSCQPSIFSFIDVWDTYETDNVYVPCEGVVGPGTEGPEPAPESGGVLSEGGGAFLLEGGGALILESEPEPFPALLEDGGALLLEDGGGVLFT